MIISSVIAVALIASVSAKVVSVGDQWVKVIDCTSSFGVCYGPTKYEMASSTGDPIRILCSSFKTGGACSNQNVTFSDGVTSSTKCGSGKYGNFLQVEQIGQKGTTEMTVSVNGQFAQMYCFAKTVHSPRDYTTLTLSPSEGTKKINAPVRTSERIEPTDDTWAIEATEGNKISLKCNTNLEDKFDGKCLKDALTINTGDGSHKVVCGKSKVSVSASKITMRLETFIWGRESKISCNVKAVKA